MNKNIHCSRKGGVQHGLKFIKQQSVSELLANQVERSADKAEKRNSRNEVTSLRRSNHAYLMMEQDKIGIKNRKAKIHARRLEKQGYQVISAELITI